MSYLARPPFLVPAVAAVLVLAACGESSPTADSPSSTAPASTVPASTVPSSTVPATTTPGTTTPSAPDSTPPASPAPVHYDHPTGADDVVIEIAYEGGFVPAGTAFTRTPLLLISGDGMAINEGPVPAIYPGPLLPNLVERTITEAGVQSLLALADDLGLLAEVEYSDPSNLVADAPDTVVTITADGRTYRHRAYALGFEDESDAARANLFKFVAAASDLPRTVGSEELGAEATYKSDTYLMQAREADLKTVDPSVSPTVVRWPADTSVRLADASECAALPAAEGDALFSDATQLTFFRQAGVVYSVAATPQLPGRTC